MKTLFSIALLLSLVTFTSCNKEEIEPTVTPTAPVVNQIDEIIQDGDWLGHNVAYYGDTLHHTVNVSPIYVEGNQLTVNNIQHTFSVVLNKVYLTDNDTGLETVWDIIELTPTKFKWVTEGIPNSTSNPVPEVYHQHEYELQ